MTKRLVIHNHFKARDAEPKFYLWAKAPGQRWGRVSPSSLVFSSKAEGEVVKVRYEEQYPNQEFRVATDINKANDKKLARDGGTREVWVGANTGGFDVASFVATLGGTLVDRAQNRYEVPQEALRRLTTKLTALGIDYDLGVRYDRSRDVARDGASHVTPLGKVNGLHLYDFHDYGQNRFQVFRSAHGPVIAGFPGRDAAVRFARGYRAKDGRMASDVSYQYHEGVEAAASGKPQSACPYPAGSNPAAQWKVGFVARHEQNVKETGRQFGQKIGGREAKLISGLLRGRHSNDAHTRDGVSRVAKMLKTDPSLYDKIDKITDQYITDKYKPPGNQAVADAAFRVASAKLVALGFTQSEARQIIHEA